MAGPIETVRCVNANCRAEIPQDVAFCPLCGGDQRPPASRTAVLCSRHETLGNGKFCIRCGAGMEAAQPGNHYTQPQPQHHAVAGVQHVQMQEPMDLWAWMMALTTFIASPLLLVENPWALLGGVFLINALFCFLDWRDMEDSGYDAVPFIVGFILPPAYLIVRSTRRRDSGAYAAVATAIFMMLIFMSVSMYQSAEAATELQNALDAMPDF